MAAWFVLAMTPLGCSAPPAGRPVSVAVDQIPDHIEAVIAKRWPGSAVLRAGLYPQGVFELVIGQPDGVPHTVQVSLEGKVLSDVRVQPLR
jgi:hypothetical protein